MKAISVTNKNFPLLSAVCAIGIPSGQLLPSTKETSTTPPQFHYKTKNAYPLQNLAMPKFEWDDNKNDSNLQKHKIRFEEATEIFDDENAIELLGNQGTKVWFLRIGKTFGKLILAVVYTLRTTIKL